MKVTKLIGYIVAIIGAVIFLIGIWLGTTLDALNIVSSIFVIFLGLCLAGLGLVVVAIFDAGNKLRSLIRYFRNGRMP